jgi:hypothetical protein
MNKKPFLLTVAILAGLVTNLLPARSASAFTPETFPVKVSSEDSLLESSVQIILVPSDPAEKTVTGIGTLVAHDGVVYLFTHNHWDSIEDWDTVYFRDAKGEPLIELYGREIDRLVVYRDEGNLVLRSPLPKKLPAARFGELGMIKPGDIVTIAYHMGKNDDTIKLQAGYVKKASERNEVPVFQLAVLNGDKFGACDCGAGVWHNGGFIGTVWQVQLDDHQSAQTGAQLRSVQELNAAQALLDMVHLRKC